ncbi:hypothetical protein ACELLULO517_22295 [Acidisoma cellulosilytica]|uniref:YCII-related domain-containing protein n=1 Tax=Acidisoma cellulosilyticum TaxID=2802395 RepID=A0A963Z6I9_9PROT|nr:YciI family protein [Acidisoma cellulosilyticum]MCB8882995.1 hypothetical protein [Acidisoma cellulosilyticum]
MAMEAGKEIRVGGISLGTLGAGMARDVVAAGYPGIDLDIDWERRRGRSSARLHWSDGFPRFLHAGSVGRTRNEARRSLDIHLWGQPMHWIIHCIEREAVATERQAYDAAHEAYLERSDLPVRVLVSGPLVADDNETSIGCFFLVEAEDRHAVDAFRSGDPFFQAGIWRVQRVQLF